MELARLRTEYHAAAGVAARVAGAAIVSFATVLVFIDGRWEALAVFVVIAAAQLLGFSTFFAGVRALALRRSRHATVVPPTLATPVGVLREEHRRPPPHASRQADAETQRRHMSTALPGVLGCCGGMAVSLAVLMALGGTPPSAIVLKFFAIVAGQAAGLTFLALLCERWTSRWEARTELVLLRDTRQPAERGEEFLYAELAG